MSLRFKILPVALPFLFVSFAHADSARYFVCASNADCVETRGTCGGRVGLNKKFVKAFDEEGRAAAAGARCGSPDPEMAKAKLNPACVKQKCELVRSN